jgi:hypothetical protein
VRDRAYEQILGGLLRLGCEIGHESQWYVTVVRGAVVMTDLPKTPLVPVDIQRRVLRVLGLTEREFLAALAGVA